MYGVKKARARVSWQALKGGCRDIHAERIERLGSSLRRTGHRARWAPSIATVRYPNPDPTPNPKPTPKPRPIRQARHRDREGLETQPCRRRCPEPQPKLDTSPNPDLTRPPALPLTQVLALQGAERGPYEMERMRGWYEDGYLRGARLLFRVGATGSFRPLKKHYPTLNVRETGPAKATLGSRFGRG